MLFPIPWTPLYPLQRSGALSLQLARWRGDERKFAVQWHEDRVYFRLFDGEPTVWASLETCAESNAVPCFEDAVRERRYGACFGGQSKVRVGRAHDFFALQFIYAPDGTGLLREWCSREWIAFAPKQTRMWALLPDLHLPDVEALESRECCQFAANSVRDQIRFRRIGDEEIAGLSWRSATDEAEFNRAMNWVFEAGLFNFGAHRKWASVALNCCLPDLQSNLHLPEPTGENNARFFDWLRAYFVGSGVEWRASNWGRRRFRKLRAREPHLRAFFEPRFVSWNVRFGDRDDPTFHQQLEARLQLRDWLHGKAAPEQIKDWLTV